MLLALTLATITGAAAPSADAALFSRHWNDNRAELSAYRLVQPRYGQPRTGEAVMIWVVEPFSRKKAVKVDDPAKAPEGEVVQVMKLNHLRDIQTGIYPYHLMTSVFLPTTPGQGGANPQGPLKIAFSSQEWCGTVFHRLVRSGDGWRSTWHSSFEQESDGTATFASSDDLLFDDELWWRVRELVQPLRAGTYRYLPGLAAARLSHVQMVTGQVGVIRSEKRAELLGSIRDTYWQHNRLGDEKLRTRLGLAP